MTHKSLRIIFMGTPDFSVAALQAILDSSHEVICVYTQPPRPKGRGQQLQKSPVHLLAEAAGVEVRHPKSLKKDAEARQALIDLNADVAVVAAYGLILPKEVLGLRHNTAASISMRLYCRAGAGRRRSRGPSSRATWKAGSPSCRWKRGSIPVR